MELLSSAWRELTCQHYRAKDPAIDALITTYATDPAYLALINHPIGYHSVDLLAQLQWRQHDGHTSSMMPSTTT